MGCTCMTKECTTLCITAKKKRNCHYHWLSVSADSDEWTKVVREEGKRVHIFNLSAHSHTINIIVNYIINGWLICNKIKCMTKYLWGWRLSFYCEVGARYPDIIPNVQWSCIPYIYICKTTSSNVITGQLSLCVHVPLFRSGSHIHTDHHLLLNQASSHIHSMYRTIFWTWPCGVPVFCAKYVFPSCAEVGHYTKIRGAVSDTSEPV